MKIVVDTNVLVSGLLTAGGPPGRVVDLIAAGELALCFNDRILFEYEDVLCRTDFPFSTEAVSRLLATVLANGVSAEALPLAKRLPDPADEPFMEVALAAGADCLITGNLRHYPRGKRQGVTVLSPAAFIERYRQRK